MGQIAKAVWALGLAGLLLAACSSSQDEQHGHTLQVNLNQTQDHPSYAALEYFSQKVDRDTDGRWQVDVYPNSTIGDQQEAVQLVRSGAQDMAIVSGTQLENLNKDFRVFDLPGIFHSIDHQMRVINNPDITAPLFQSLEKRHITVLGGFTQGRRQLYTTRGPIKRPADLDGQKIRVQESQTQLDMIQRMGGSPNPMSYGEVYTALQSGVIDGAENNLISYHTQKHYEVAPYLARTSHAIGVDYLIINTQVLKAMSAADRQKLQTAFQAAARRHTHIWKEQTRKARKELAAKGVHFNDVAQPCFEQAFQPLIKKTLTTPLMKKLYQRTREQANP